ncbi:serine/threonine-protein kinase [Pseudonocardia sp. KRD291]|uniref:serine/threonine-protein kinase n=1 Tax=Pseudonocardia sp. KRD291 TaxID=2792007 RepID=UPI001C49F70A|nr:serine/threonine-protein kinase [Pseudonocardia sp. KRD291]MBW0106511.1 protein kinase [Pseudonocardia sp. KRD291]
MVGTSVSGQGSSVGPYQIEALIGRGGMGEVYRAFDTRRGRVVALKLISPGNAHDETYRARFRRESDSAAGLRDPHVVPIHDFGEIDGRLFLDMRLIDGAGLDTVLTQGPMSPTRAVAIIGQVAQALGSAHVQGVVHRDVKPSNILLTSEDFAYLVDFGIARSMDDGGTLTTAGSTIGTLAYMAPERFDGGAPDQRSDTYSLACVLAECLLGRAPFDGKSLPTLMKAHLVAEPPRPSRLRPDVPAALDTVIARGMAKDPTARYGSVYDFALAAQNALVPPTGHHRPQSTRVVTPARTVDARMDAFRAEAVRRNGPPPAPAKKAKRWRRTKAVTAAVGAVVLIGLVSFGVGRFTAATPVAAADRTVTSTAPTAPEAPVSTSPAPTATPSSSPVSGNRSQPSAFTYTVESNYPVVLGYTAANGDSVTRMSVPAPWTLKIATDAWGSDARPMLTASSTSTKGDTYVSCTITDSDGKVVATDRKESSFASAMCLNFS